MTTLAFDLETDGLLRECTRIWVLGIGDADTRERVTYTDYDPDFPPLAEGLARLQAADRLIAHNGIGFDYKAVKKIKGIQLDYDKLIDTLIVARLGNPERRNGHSLDSWGVELGLLKGSHDDWSCYSEDMRAYCDQDIAVTLALYDRHRKIIDEWGYSVALEHKVARLIDMQMDNGFLLDIRAATELAAKLHDDRTVLETRLTRMFEPIYVGAGQLVPKRDNAKTGYMAGAELSKITLQEFNPQSTHHVADRLKRRYGWIAPVTEAGNPNIDEAVLKKLDFPEAALLLEHARVNKLFTQVAGPKKKNGTGGGWLHRVDENCRIHGYVNPNGAVTGRMTHSGPNMANIDKDPRARALFLPKPGWSLVGFDAEGLELRMLAHYLWPWDQGALAHALLEGDKAKGTDAHSMNKKNTDLFSRDGAKTLLYGSLYGAGDEKAGKIWVADWRASGKPVAEWPSWALTQTGKLKPAKAIGKVVKQRLIDGIKGFRELINAVQAKAKKFGFLRGPDGRKIWVRSEHAALNTLLQGSGAIVMKQALIEFDARVTSCGLVHGAHYGLCANVHDEVQVECVPEQAEFIGASGCTAISRAGTFFNIRCRLDGAFDIGNNWHETH